MYSKIISVKNFVDAYLELAEKLDITCRSNSYSGIDGQSFNDYNYSADELINQARSELIEKKIINPAVSIKIPKINGKLREVFIYSIKDRLKAQAIYRVIAPEIEKVLSSFLFSYRQNYPSDSAAKSVARRYRNYYGKDFVMVADISDYGRSIDRDILRRKLVEANIDLKTIDLINLFIGASFWRNEKIESLEKGLNDGIPLVVLCNNLYLNDLDHIIGKKVALYRRVGDDLILCDQNKDKINNLREVIIEEVKNLKLNLKKEKTQLIINTQKFKFLGYIFYNQKISIAPTIVQKIIVKWGNKFKYYPVKTSKKIYYLKKIFFENKPTMLQEFKQLILTRPLANNEDQYKQINNQFNKILTRYLFGRYTPRNQRNALKLIRPLKLPTIYKTFINFHYGRSKVRS